MAPAPMPHCRASDTDFDFKLQVKSGKVIIAGFWPVKATGGIDKLGVVNITLAHGCQRAIATGPDGGDATSAD